MLWRTCAAAIVLLAMMLVPAAAEAGNKAGGGAVLGSMSYGDGGIPRVLGGCNDEMPTTFDVAAEAFVVDTQIVGYAGPVHIWNRDNGPGLSGCESIMLGGGDLTVDLEGDNDVNGAHIECDDLDGTWIRVFNAVTVRFTGICYIGAFDIPTPVVFVGTLTHVQDEVDQGAGVDESITSATVTGPFAILPG